MFDCWNGLKSWKILIFFNIFFYRNQNDDPFEMDSLFGNKYDANDIEQHRI